MFRERHKAIFIIMGFLSFLFGRYAGPQPVDDPADMGRGMRQMMLATPAEKSGVSPSKDFPRVFGVLMDWPIGADTATVFATSTGTASLYTTSTFGIIGGEAHENVRAAAIRLVRAADQFYESALPVTEYPYPPADRVRFYLLTFDGVRCIDTDLAAIEAQTSEYSGFFDLGQSVLSELRRVTERK